MRCGAYACMAPTIVQKVTTAQGPEDTLKPLTLHRASGIGAAFARLDFPTEIPPLVPLAPFLHVAFDLLGARQRSQRVRFRSLVKLPPDGRRLRRASFLEQGSQRHRLRPAFDRTRFRHRLRQGLALNGQGRLGEFKGNAPALRGLLIALGLTLS